MVIEKKDEKLVFCALGNAILSADHSRVSKLSREVGQQRVPNIHQMQLALALAWEHEHQRSLLLIEWHPLSRSLLARSIERILKGTQQSYEVDHQIALALVDRMQESDVCNVINHFRTAKELVQAERVSGLTIHGTLKKQLSAALQKGVLKGLETSSQTIEIDDLALQLRALSLEEESRLQAILALPEPKARKVYSPSFDKLRGDQPALSTQNSDVATMQYSPDGSSLMSCKV